MSVFIVVVLLIGFSLVANRVFRELSRLSGNLKFQEKKVKKYENDFLALSFRVRELESQLGQQSRDTGIQSEPIDVDLPAVDQADSVHENVDPSKIDEEKDVREVDLIRNNLPAKKEVIPVQAKETSLPPTISAPFAKVKESNTDKKAKSHFRDDNTTKKQTPKSASLEESFGTKWTVWIGGIAFALGGIFMVRHSIESGYFGPGVRIILAVLFGLVLLAIGEWTRRKSWLTERLPMNNISIPAMTTAAGIVVLYASAYGAYALYGFIDGGVAFALMAFVSALGMLAAIHHGKSLAAIGFVGAYVTPLLASSSDPSIVAVIAYLIFVTASVCAFARISNWVWLVVCSAVAAPIWALLIIWQASVLEHKLEIAAYIGCLAIIFVVTYFWRAGDFGKKEKFAKMEFVSAGTLATLGALALLLEYSAGTTAGILGLLAVLFGMFIMLASLYSSAIFMIVIAAGLFLFHISIALFLSLEVIGSVQEVSGRDGYVFLHWQIAIASAVLIISSTIWLLRNMTRNVIVAEIWSLTGTIAPIIALILVWSRLENWYSAQFYAWWGLVLGLVFSVITLRLLMVWPARRNSLEFAAWPVAVVAVTCFSLAIVLDGPWLTIALALTAMGTVAVACQLGVYQLVPVSSILAILLVLRSIIMPEILIGGVGETPVFNWLLWTYGIPATCFFVSARLLESLTNTHKHRQCLDAVSMILAVGLVITQIRHMFHGDVFFIFASLDLPEAACLLIAGTVMAIGYGRSAQKLKNQIMQTGSDFLAMIFFSVILVLLVLVLNPLVTKEPVGDGLLFNHLTLAYLLTGLCGFVFAWDARQRKRPAYVVTIAGIAASVLLFFWAHLAIRHIFHGDSQFARAWPELPEIALQLIFGIIISICRGRLLPGSESQVLRNGRDFVSLLYILVLPFLIILPFNPMVSGEPVGDGMIYNNLSLSYLLTGLTCFVFAWNAKQQFRRSELITIAGFTGGVLVLFWGHLVVRHLFHGDILFSYARFNLPEVAVHQIVGVLLSLVLGILADRYGNSLMRSGSIVLALFFVTFLPVLLIWPMNPVFTGETVGNTFIFNNLSVGYLLPGLGCFLLAWVAQRTNWNRNLVLIAYGACGTLIFVWANLVVRQFYHGSNLLAGNTTEIELYTYSAVWLICGVLLLPVSNILGNQHIRFASSILVGLAVLKIFLFDASHLEGILRALSFIGLGVVLMGLGAFYKKILFLNNKSRAISAESI